MPKLHPAVRLEQQRANLKRWQTKKKRAETAIKKLNRSIAALERSAAAAGPVPAPEPKQPRPAPAPDPDAVLLAEFQTHAERFARILGVVKPRSRIAGSPGWDHCKRAARAHCHTDEVWWRPRVTGKAWRARGTNIPRGTICLNRNFLRNCAGRSNGLAELAAHEVSHLTRSKKKRGYGNAHGRGFYENMGKALGVTPEQAKAIDTAGGFDLDDEGVPQPVKRPEHSIKQCPHCPWAAKVSEAAAVEHIARHHPEDPVAKLADQVPA